MGKTKKRKIGKCLVVDATVRNYLEELDAGTSYISGLLVGQKEFVVLAMRTPQAEGAENELQNWLNDDDKQRIVDHADQVNQMLPGGLSVMGMFLISASISFKDAQSKMMQSMLAVDARLSENRYWEPSEEDISERVLLHLSPNKNKVHCWVIDVQNTAQSPKTVAITYQPSITEFWIIIICFIDIDLMFPLHERTPQSLNQCMKNGLKKWAKQIDGSVCHINGKQLPDDTHLNPPTNRKQLNASRLMLRAQIFLPTVEQVSEKLSTASVEVCSCILRLQGRLQCNAYLNHSKVTAKDITMLIKRDIVSCVTSSARSFFQYMMNDKKASAFVESQPLAQRVFAAVPNSGICVCDFMLPAETEDAVKERIKQRTDLSVENLHLSQKNIEGILQWHQDTGKAIDSTWRPVYQMRKSRKKIYIGLIVTAGVALVAVSLTLILRSEE